MKKGRLPLTKTCIALSIILYSNSGFTSESINARFIRVIAEKEVNNNNWASAAEFYFYQKNTPILLPNKRVHSISSEEVQYGEVADNAIDGDINTIWHSNWSETNEDFPHEFVIDLGEQVNIDGLGYLPRQDGNQNGFISQASVFYSNDGEDWQLAGKWQSSYQTETVYFPFTNVEQEGVKTVIADCFDCWNEFASHGLLSQSVYAGNVSPYWAREGGLATTSRQETPEGQIISTDFYFEPVSSETGEKKDQSIILSDADVVNASFSVYNKSSGEDKWQNFSNTFSQDTLYVTSLGNTGNACNQDEANFAREFGILTSTDDIKVPSSHYKACDFVLLTAVDAQETDQIIAVTGYVQYEDYFGKHITDAGTAPGTEFMEFTIAAPYSYSYKNNENGEQVNSTSGTSFSSPYVARYAAIIKKHRPDYTNSDIRKLIFDTAIDVGEPGVDPVYGHGLLNPDGIMAALGITDPE